VKFPPSLNTPFSFLSPLLTLRIWDRLCPKFLVLYEEADFTEGAFRNG